MIKRILQTVVISALTSLVLSPIFFFLFLHTITPSLITKLYTSLPISKAKIPAKDAHFAKYEGIINNFLDTIRKGDIEAAYNSTSPIFQKKTTLSDFKSLIADYKVAQNIPSAHCSLTEYSEPSSDTIKDLPGNYMIVQTKCEATENGGIKGFNIELIDDNSIPKISYVNAYKGPVIHKKEL